MEQKLIKEIINGNLQMDNCKYLDVVKVLLQNGTDANFIKNEDILNDLKINTLFLLLLSKENKKILESKGVIIDKHHIHNFKNKILIIKS